MATKNDLRAAQNAIAAALSQHAAYQYRASSSIVNAFDKRLLELTGGLAKDLLYLLDGLTKSEMQWFLSGQYKTARLKRLRDAIKAYGNDVGKALASEWSESAPKLAAYEAGYAAQVLGQAVEGLPKENIAGAAVYAKAMKTPFSGAAPYGGKLVQELLDGFGSKHADQVMAAVRSGVVSGQTNSQIVKVVRGTAALNYQDGIVQIARGDAERFIRTARNHISNQAMAETYEKLGVTHVVFVATLDGRTSRLCASLDGKAWKVDEPHPTPPLHPNCRSVIVPSLDGELIGQRPYMRALKVKKRDGSDRFRSVGDMTKKQREEAGLEQGQVSAGTSYSSWFKSQDSAFQSEWLGPTRYKLYQEGKYGLSRFVDPLSGKQYTIDELRARDAETFRQIFGD
ncbi:MAG: hypothetical protein KER_03078 [Kerstersia gyiorum]|uniref:minor capsid protein n=1 Tax=Kerstersia gyiorum TaxID=206506 RepID=UPI0030D4EBBA